MEIKLDVINHGIVNDTSNFIKECEAGYHLQVDRIAEYILEHHRTRPIILVSGPSGSGKTTTAHLLEADLERAGLRTHIISMDNYFKTLSDEEKRLAAAKKLDLEAPDRVDQALLNQQLRQMLSGETVNIPAFDFAESRRVQSGETITRREHEVIIIEGIHALNPDVIGLPDDTTVRIYVSVRTRIEDENGCRLHPKKIRLMRRMLRDQHGRARHPADTLKMFDSVQRGENRYIMPYKPHAMFDVDTIVPYEIGVYRDRLMTELAAMPPHQETRDMLAFLEKTAPLSETLVPADSLIQEFIKI